MEFWSDGIELYLFHSWKTDFLTDSIFFAFLSIIFISQSNAWKTFEKLRTRKWVYEMTVWKIRLTFLFSVILKKCISFFQNRKTLRHVQGIGRDGDPLLWVRLQSTRFRRGRRTSHARNLENRNSGSKTVFPLCKVNERNFVLFSRNSKHFLIHRSKYIKSDI